MDEWARSVVIGLVLVLETIPRLSIPAFEILQHNRATAQRDIAISAV